jgi:putative Mn2+ efflux pump MntP
VRIVVGIFLVGWFSVALVDRVQHDASLWRIVSAVLLIGLGAAQIVSGIRDQRGTSTTDSTRRPPT